MGTLVDTHEEATLLDAVKSASSLVDEGLSPNDAFGKVARDMQLTPGRVRTVCFAYNQGRQANQRENNDSALGKFASFPLADPQAVIADVFGVQKAAAAVDPDYRQFPGWIDRALAAPTLRVKAAAAAAPTFSTPTYVPDYDKEELRRRSKVAAAGQAVEEQRRQRSALTDQLRAKTAALVAYFHQPRGLRLSFAAADQAAGAYLGKAASALMSCVHSQLHSGEKRAAATLAVTNEPVTMTAEPFITIKACVKLARDITSLAPPVVPPPVPTPVYQPLDCSLLSADGAREKEAGILGTPAVGAALGSFLSRGIGSVPKTKDDLIDDAQLDLEDPAHQNELRKIQANTMLTSLMTDPNDPIGGHDPDKVLREYNEVSRLTPRLAEQPAVLRSVLQRRLQGGVQPFEAKELADIEKTLTQTRSINPAKGQDNGELG